MTGESKEYSRRKREEHREYSDEETDRIVRESIDEIRKEIEGKESSEPLELPEQVYDSERCVREAIEEVQQEEVERLRLKEQKELEDEQQEFKEPREIPEEYDADRCVREAIAEVQQEEAERQRLREERELVEMEKEEQLEASREERKETADKDDFEELERRILERFDDYGIDPEEVKERWRKRFEEDVQDELGEQSRKETEREGEEDETAGQERAAEGHYSYDDGSGQMYEVKMDSKESSGAETESCSEVQEDSEGIPSTPEKEENTKGSGEIEPEEVKLTQETEDNVGEHPKKREGDEQEESSKVETEEVRKVKESTVKESTDNEIKENAPEIRTDSEKKSSQSDEQGKESISTPEIDTKPQVNEIDEHIESEVSQVAEEKLEDASESREEEIWSNYEIEHDSLHDESYRKYLREVLNRLPEEERERFIQYVREQVRTIEDFEELVRKHGLDELLEDEEVMEEVRNYLELRRALENEPDTDIGQLAEELGIDAEQAIRWSKGESEPLSLKKLLNLEAYYLMDEIARSHREQNYPESREELESILETNSELRADRLFPLEQDDAIAWVEIMAMRRRGEIRRRIRNGREVYSRQQIMELSEKYAVSAHEIISWLRGEQVPSLIRKIGSKKLKKKNIERISFNTGDLIGSKAIFEQVLSRNQNLRLDKRFETWYRDVMIYFTLVEELAKGEVNLEEFSQESGISVWKLRKIRRERPYLLNRLERSELRRIYADINGGAPEVSIESMEDLKRLLDIHEDLKLDDYNKCETYFEMRKLRAQGWTYTKLSKKFKMSRTNINLWLNEYPPKPIPKLRQAEEQRLVQNWAEKQVLKLRISADNESEQRRKLRKVVLPSNGKMDNLEALENAVKHLASQLGSSSERVLYAEIDYDNEQFLSNKDRLEQLMKEVLDREVHLALVDGRLYIWAPNNHLFRLINLYRDLYFYFPNAADFAKFLEQTKADLDKSMNTNLGRTHLENLISQICDMEKSVSFRNEKGRRFFRIKGQHLQLLLDIRGLVLSDLEGKISKLTGFSGYGGIVNPRFPTGERLASILARLYTTIGCDGSITKNGQVKYWEQHLDRIDCVAKNLRKLGDININPKLEKDNLYCCHMPTIIGSILQQMGLHTGNKTRHNPKLSREFLDAMSWNISRDFVADTIPEDGTINLRKRAIACTHSVQLTSDIGQDEIDLIKGQGKKEGCRWRLPFGKLKRLRDSTDSRIAKTAKKLYKLVMVKPSNQIMDEKEVVEKLGVKLTISPISVHYHGKSGNVTVSWRWRTAGETEARKLAIIAPPNDVKKREVLRKWLLGNHKETEEMYKELRSQGNNVSRWWIDE